MKHPGFRVHTCSLLMLLLLGTSWLLAQKPVLISNQQGHLDTIIHLDVSPHAHLMATIGRDRQLILWDYPSAKILRRLPSQHHFKEVWFLDEERVATFDENNQVRIWDVNTGQYTLDTGNSELQLMNYALNADRTLLALQGVNGSLSLYEIGKKGLRWQIENTPIKGFLHFNPKSSRLILRNELGVIQEVRNTSNGSAARSKRDFFQPEFPPKKLHRIEFDKASYAQDEQGYVVDFSKERAYSFPLQQATDSPIPFAYSRDGETLVTFEIEKSGFSLGGGFQTYSYQTYISVIHLTSGQTKRRVYPDNYLSIHLAENGGMLLAIDDFHDIHFIPSSLPENHDRAFIQPSIYHTKTQIEPDLKTVSLYKFDSHGLRTIDLTTREDWQKVQGRASLSRGAVPWFDAPSASNSTPNFIYVAHTKSRVLVNCREAPLEGEYMGGPFDYTALYDKEGNLLRTYNIFADEVRFSPNENLAIAKWYTVDEDHTPAYEVANVYGDIKRHGPYELGIWDYEAGDFIPGIPSQGVSDMYLATLLQTSSGLNRFHAFHFDQEEVYALHIAQGKKTEYWNLSKQQLLAEQAWSDEMIATTFLGDGQRALSTFATGKMVLWQPSTGQIQEEWQDVGLFYSIKVSPNHRYISLRNKGKASIFDLQRGKILLQTGEDRPYPTTMFGIREIYSGRNMGEVSDLQIDEKAHKAISSHYDGSLMFWDLQDGKLLATQHSIGSNEWVVISPTGLFDASAGALNLLYFTIGTEIIELEQLKERYFEPGLLQKLMGFSSERIRPVDQLDEVALYPKITEETSIQNNILHIKLLERNGGIGPVSILINGKEVSAEANPLPRIPGAKRSSDFTFDLKPFERLFLKGAQEINVISIRAYNEEEWLKSAAYEIPYTYQIVSSKGSGNASEDVQLKYDPKLYVVCIGTSQYTGDQLDLRYADQDARSMATALYASGTALFNAKGDSVEVYCLTTDIEKKVKPSIDWKFSNKPNIEATFQALALKAKAEDILVVYLSGHGITYGNADQAQFHYLTQGIASIDLSDSYTRSAYTISGEELTRMINAVPALKQVLIIDACNSGQILSSLQEGQKSLNSSQIRALDRMKDRTGMFLLSGSAANKVSYEASQYGQGLLTFSLLQGMKLVAARNEDNLDIMQLFQYARDQVPNLAKGIGGIQRPVLAFPRHGSSFDIGIVNEQVKIPVASKKSVFIRNFFIEEKTLDDSLDIGKSLNQYFQKVSSKGADAAYLYVDVNEYDNAYSIKGIYTLDENRITLRAALFQGKKKMGQFDLQGFQDDVNALIDELVQEVEWMLQ